MLLIYTTILLLLLSTQSAIALYNNKAPILAKRSPAAPLNDRPGKFILKRQLNTSASSAPEDLPLVTDTPPPEGSSSSFGFIDTQSTAVIQETSTVDASTSSALDGTTASVGSSVAETTTSVETSRAGDTTPVSPTETSESSTMNNVTDTTETPNQLPDTTEAPTSSEPPTPPPDTTETPTLSEISSPSDIPTTSTTIPTMSTIDIPPPTDSTTEPTNSPTSSPTDNPTDNQTVSQTDSPTDSSTDSSTVSPTDSPTDSSTVSPTDSSTDGPTDSPTQSPTEPTDVPSSPTSIHTDTTPTGNTIERTTTPSPTPIPTITAPPPIITTSTTPTPDSAVCSQGFYRCADQFGGGCCSSGFECTTSKCVIPPTTSMGCGPGFFLCPYSVEGGCCPNGRRCGRTTCEAQPTTVVTSKDVTVLPPPVTTTDSAGSVETKTLKPIVIQEIKTYTMTQIITKYSLTPFIVHPNSTEIPQVSPVPKQASNARKLEGGAIGGIVGGGIIAVVVLLSAVIFTWRRLYARGNFDLPTGFGGAAFGGHKRKRRSGRQGAVDDGAVMSGTYDPRSPGGAAQRQQMLQGSKFGRSASGSSGDGYRGATTLGGVKQNRGSDPFYPPGTTVTGSDGEDKSANSPTIVSIHPVTPPAGAGPPVYHEADGVPIPPPTGPYGDMNPQDAYVMEIGDGSPLPLPVQRWQVTNPDQESVSSRAPSRVGHGGDRVQVHPGTNF